MELAFVNFKKDSYLSVEGNVNADRFFIIQQGQVQCLFENEDSNSPRLVCGPGDCIGVIACMAGQTQIETVVALTDIVAIAVRREQYSELIAKNSRIAFKIILGFASRTRFLNETLVNLSLSQAATRFDEMLFMIAAYYDKAHKYAPAVFAYYQYLHTYPTGVNVVAAKERFVALHPKAKVVHFVDSTEMIRDYATGTMIFAEGQNGQDMFIIQGGRVCISKIIDNSEVILAVLQKGDFFGEMALLENRPRSANAIAYDDCRLMALNRANFDQMVKTQPQLVSRLTTTLAERLWSMYRTIGNANIKDPVSQLYDMLAIQIEKLKVPLNQSFPHQFDLTPQDLANMCGMPTVAQAGPLSQFVDNSRVKLVNGKIFVSDCLLIFTMATFNRRRTGKSKD